MKSPRESLGNYSSVKTLSLDFNSVVARLAVATLVEVSRRDEAQSVARLEVCAKLVLVGIVRPSHTLAPVDDSLGTSGRRHVERRQCEHRCNAVEGAIVWVSLGTSCESLEGANTRVRDSNSVGDVDFVTRCLIRHDQRSKLDSD